VTKIVAIDSGLSHDDAGNCDHLAKTSARYCTSLRDKSRFFNMRAYPLLLVGTYNKQSGYARRPFLHLHYQFAHALQHSNRLVIAGYGWGDDGINAHIYNWMESSTDNKIVNIDPWFEEVRKRTRSGAAFAFRCWNKGSRLRVTTNKIEETSWAEIHRQFQQ
jgi:hypothetical protein